MQEDFNRLAFSGLYNLILRDNEKELREELFHWRLNKHASSTPIRRFMCRTLFQCSR